MTEQLLPVAAAEQEHEALQILAQLGNAVGGVAAWGRSSVSTPIADLPAGVQLSFYGSAFVLGAPDFPLADIPLQDDRQGRGRALPRQARPGVRPR